MVSAKRKHARKLSPARVERKRRLLLIFPEVAEELERRRKNNQLNGKQIKEIDRALLALANFEARLKAHEMAYDCSLGKIVGPDADSKEAIVLYQATTAKRDLGSFLDGEYHAMQEVFNNKNMEVPLVLQLLYKAYKSFDTPSHNDDGSGLFPYRGTDC